MRHQAGGFDKQLLDSLYEDDAARRRLQMQSTGMLNSFEQPNPFALSHNMAPHMSMQMAMMGQGQHQMMLQQQQQMMMQQQQSMLPQLYQQNMMMVHCQYQPYYPQHQPKGSTNPFEDPFHFPQSLTPRQI